MYQLKSSVDECYYSYPYINGLHLLLRSSGTAKIRSQGKKQVLILDAATLESWSNLNLTERYFNLLEAWLIWGNNEILGEHQDSFGKRHWINL
ncbi:MAG: hypothetical protein V7K88_01595 [Nostoc sp.]|uniref:hypothetical protein n=1 Tax=Nostoc sp. TaxID=1180 RepID=UPI002FFABE7E